MRAMAGLRREFRVAASAHKVWDAFRDVFAVHRNRRRPRPVGDGNNIEAVCMA